MATLRLYKSPEHYLLRITTHHLIVDMDIASPSEVIFTCKLTENFQKKNILLILKTRLLVQQDSGGQ